MSPTVFVVDDDEASREGVALLLETEGHRVSRFPDAESFLATHAVEATGCLVLDQRMPGMSGTDMQAELARRGNRMPIIFLSAFGDVPTTARAMRAGAVDFLTKPVDGRLLVERVRACLGAAESERRLAAACARQRAGAALLTGREREVLSMAISGASNKTIAEGLGISARTVEVHRSRVFLKLGVRSLVELHTQAESLGLTLRELLDLPAPPGPA